MSGPLASVLDGSDVCEVPAEPKALRLSEADQIAAERLRNGGEVPLQEISADASADAPAEPRPPLTQRIDAISNGLDTVSDAPAAPQVPLPDVGARESLYLRMAQPTAEAGPDAVSEVAGALQAQPAVEADTLRPAEGAASADPATEAAAIDPGTAPLETAVAAEDSAQAQAAGERAPEPVVAPLESEAPPPQPRPAASAPRLAEAIDAAAQIAAGATAASEAIENLKRLLQRQLPDAPVRMPDLPPPPRPRPAKAKAHPPVPAASPPVMPQPPPTTAPTSSALPADPVPMPLPTAPALAERRGLDVRGFLAGFVLSWAIGAVLYVYLMAG